MNRLLVALFWSFSVPATLCFGAQTNEVAAAEGLSLIVEYKTGEGTIIEFSTAWTVEILKEKIASILKLPDTNFHIIHKKVILKDLIALPNNSIVEITQNLPEPELIEVFIKTLQHRTLTIFIRPKSSVAELKAKIHKEEGIPVEKMRLIYAGRQLEDDYAITNYGIRQHSTIHITLRLAGD